MVEKLLSQQPHDLLQGDFCTRKLPFISNRKWGKISSTKNSFFQQKLVKKDLGRFRSYLGVSFTHYLVKKTVGIFMRYIFVESPFLKGFF